MYAGSTFTSNRSFITCGGVFVSEYRKDKLKKNEKIESKK